jgi:hypothetical protein
MDIESFHSSIIIVIYSLIHSKPQNYDKIIDAVLNLSFKKIYYIKNLLIINLTPIENAKTSNEKLYLLSKELTRITHGLKFLELSFPENAFWQQTLSPKIWEFLHVVAFQLDLQGGIKEKSKFLYFIKDLVLCSICYQHYQATFPHLVNSLTVASLSETLFAFHTYVTETIKPIHEQKHFQFHTKLINRYFERNFFYLFLKLKVSKKFTNTLRQFDT